MDLLTRLTHCQKMLSYAAPDCLETRIEEFLRERLGDSFIQVMFEDEHDGDGDPILIIGVVTKDRPEPSKLRGVARGLMAITEGETDSFPLLSYRSPRTQPRSVRATA